MEMLIRGVLKLGLFFIPPILFEFLWNHVVPIFWAAAPKIGFWDSVGVILLIGVIRISCGK